MRGHIRRQSKKSWEIVIELPRDPATGRRRQHFETVRGSKKDAERRLGELINSLDRGGFVQPSRITLGQWLGTWLESCVVPNLKAQTADSYISEIRVHLVPALGAVPLQRLTPQHLQDYYARALREGRTDGTGGLSASTVRYHHRILHRALKQAVKMGYLGRNVTDAVDPPRLQRRVMPTMAREDIPRFLEAARDNFYFIVFYTALFTGMRLGELLGLRWCDVDLDMGHISVVQSLYKRAGVCKIGAPKSRSSRRRITLSVSLIEILSRHRMEQEAQGIMLGRPLQETDLVFAYPGNRPLDPSTVTHAFARVLKEAGLNRIRFHDLRHTHGTLLLVAGVNPKIVSERLGHSSVAFTMDVYSHVVPGLQETAAERFEQLISSVSPGEKNVGKPPKLAQARKGEGMLANGRLDVGKMLGKVPKEDDITSKIECEPRRTRTSNRLIKSQLLCQLS
jgi:integrase